MILFVPFMAGFMFVFGCLSGLTVFIWIAEKLDSWWREDY